MGILRLYLAICVAAAHANLSLFGFPLLDSRSAVLVFFCISGFLMTLILSSGRYSTGNWILAFYLSRSLRIYPLYWLVLTIVALCWATGFVDTGINFTNGVSPLDIIAKSWPIAGLESRAILLLTNITTFGQEMLLYTTFDPVTAEISTVARIPPKMSGAALEIVGLSWTLGVELLFYVLAPFIVQKVWRITLASLAAFVVVSIVRHEQPLFGFAALISNGDAFLRYLPFFLTGASLYHLGVGRNFSAVVPLLLSGSQVISFCMGIVGLQSTLFILVLASLIPVLFLKLSSASDNFLGDLSYPIYITHFIVMQACRTYVSADIYPLAVSVAILVAGVVVALLLERPIDAVRYSLAKRLMAGTKLA